MTQARFRVAAESDDADLRALLRENPMDGWIQLCLEREPSFFLGEGLLGEATVMVARAEAGDGPLIGSCTCTWMPLHVNGEVRRIPYLGGLRLASAFRNRPHLLRQGFRALDDLAGFRPSTPLAFTSLASANQRARRLLETGLPGFPHYTPMAEVDTWVLPATGKSLGRLEPAKASDIPELIQVINATGRTSQFAPHLTEEWLTSGPGSLRVEDFLVRRESGEIQACMALWDQRAYKQVRIHGYRPPLNTLRTPWNVWSAVRRGVRLPPPGDRLDACFLAFASFRAADWEEAAADVQEALAWAARRGSTVALLGLPIRHPLGRWLRKGRAPWTYRTCIEAVRWPTAVPFFPDGRPVHPEIALL